jgi:hypothetical protein
MSWITLGLGHATEIGRVLDIGRWAASHRSRLSVTFDRLPLFVALEDIGVFLLERLARDGRVDQIGDFLVGGPDVLQVDRLAVLAGAKRLGRQVDVHVAGQRIGHDQRRAGQVVGPHVGLIRPSKLRLPDRTAAATRSPSAIAAEISGCKRARVADAGGAAIAHEVEADGIQILLQARGVQIFADTTCDPGASEVLTQGLRVRPSARALRATSPAPIIT